MLENEQVKINKYLLKMFNWSKITLLKIILITVLNDYSL